VYDKQVSEDDLEELRESWVDISKPLGRVPSQIVVVSKVGFAKRACGWANRESKWVGLRQDDSPEKKAQIELIRETLREHSRFG
jgi:hypothetical protein